jgi:hypothetical protein
MRNSRFAGMPALDVSREIDDVARFEGLACKPSANGYRSILLGDIGVFVQTMDFVDLRDGSRRPAPPIVIGPVRIQRFAAEMAANVAARLSVVTAIDAVVGDDDAPDAIPKAVVCAMVFGIAVSTDAEPDFEAWRTCRRDLAAWYRARFSPPVRSPKPNSKPSALARAAI